MALFVHSYGCNNHMILPDVGEIWERVGTNLSWTHLSDPEWDKIIIKRRMGDEPTEGGWVDFTSMTGNESYLVMTVFLECYGYCTS